MIETYQAILGAKLILNYPYEADMTDNANLVGKVFHAEFKIGGLNFYLADTGEEPDFSSVKFVIETTNETEAHEIFDKLTQGGKIISEFEKMPFGPTIADVQDKFGIKWNIVIC